MARVGLLLLALLGTLAGCEQAPKSATSAPTNSPDQSKAAAGQASSPADSTLDTSDAALVKTLPGFANGYTTVNGIRLHYVTGGKGTPLVLLPGHPET